MLWGRPQKVFHHTCSCKCVVRWDSRKTFGLIVHRFCDKWCHSLTSNREQVLVRLSKVRFSAQFTSFLLFSFWALDAEECWTQIVNSLSVLPGVVVPGAPSQKKFVEQFMAGEMTTEYVFRYTVKSSLLVQQVEMRRSAGRRADNIKRKNNQSVV